MQPRFWTLLLSCLVALFSNACQTGSHSIKPPSYAKAVHLYDGVEAIAAKLTESAQQSQKTGQIQKVAVADFIGPHDRLSGLGEYMADKISVRLFGTGVFPDIMERRQLKQVLQSRKGELSGYFDQSTVKQFGKMIGIDSMVIGTIKDLGGFLDVTAKIVHAESGRILSLADIRIKKDRTTQGLLAKQNTATLTVSVDPPVSGKVAAGSMQAYLDNGIAVLKGLPYGACSVVVQPRGQDQIRRSITIQSPSETLSVKIQDKLYAAGFQVVPPDAKLTVAGQAVALNNQGFATVKGLKNQTYSYVAQAKDHEYHTGRFNPAAQPDVLVKLGTSDPFLSLKNKFFQKYKAMQNQQGFGVKLWTDKSAYRVGDTIAFFFQAQKDCYLTLVNINASGSITQLFPNRFHSNNRVRAGVQYRIPDKSYGFEFEVEPPGGVERVYAVASTYPINLFDNDFQQAAFTSLNPNRTRDISVKQVGSRLDSIRLGAAAECIVQSKP